VLGTNGKEASKERMAVTWGRFYKNEEQSSRELHHKPVTLYEGNLLLER